MVINSIQWFCLPLLNHLPIMKHITFKLVEYAIYECGENDILKHLASALDELLGSILLAYKNIITTVYYSYWYKQYDCLKINGLSPNYN